MHIFPDNLRKFTGVPSGVRAITVGLLLMGFLLIGTLSINGKSKTVDENAHYLYGRNILLNGDATRFDDSKMPVTVLNALPRKIGRMLAPGKIRSFCLDFLAARLVTLLFSAFMALVVFFWSRSLYGFIPAIFSLVLYLLDPSILAHSGLVTTDIYAAGTTLLVFFFLWRFARRRTILNGLLCALSLGISLIAKYSAVVLIPLALFTLLVFDFSGIFQSYKDHRSLLVTKFWPFGNFRGSYPDLGVRASVRTLAPPNPAPFTANPKEPKFFRNYVIYLVVTLIVSTLVINISFLSDRTFTRFSDYRFQSGFFRSLQLVPGLRKLPVPFPYPYLEGLDLVLQNERTGASYGNIYLLGQTRPGNDGFAGYFFVAALLKVPITSQLIYIAAFFIYFRDPQRRKKLFSDEIFLFVPVVFFAIYYNFFFNAQIGIRYYLVVFPFLYIFSGHLFKNFIEFSRAKKTLVFGLMLYLVLSVFSYYPNFLPYFNEIVWDRFQAYRFLADSNIDWGQNSEELTEYLSAHSEAVYAPEKMQPGLIVVSVNQLTGVQGNSETYKWLRDNFHPVDTISYTYLIYQVSADEIARLCSASEYCD